MLKSQIIVLRKCSTLYSVCDDRCCIMEQKKIGRKFKKKFKNRVGHDLHGEKFLYNYSYTKKIIKY